MKSPGNLYVKIGSTLAAVSVCLAFLFGGVFTRTLAQVPAVGAATNASAAAATGVGTVAPTNAPGVGTEPTNAPAASATNAPVASTNAASSTNEIELSFQGANVDMIVKWLSQQTGKSVIKHPRVQCQITISSSRKVTPREGINLIYRALSLEGFSAIESSNSILLVPQDQEPRMSPLLLDASQNVIPEGRQKIVKIFPLAHIPPAEMRERIRGVLSDKGVAEVSDAANHLIVTDYNENLRIVAELIRELDTTDADTAIRTYQIKYGDAEEVGNWLNLILNVPTAGAGSASRPGSRPSGSPTPPGMPSMPGGDPSSGGGGGGGAAGATIPQVRLWPDKAANRLIVSAPRVKFPEVERLLEVLDAEKSRDVAVRLIPLKNLTATDLMREIGPLLQRMGARSTAREVVEVSANDQSNSLIVLSSEANYRAIMSLIASLDTEDAQDKITKTFELKNAEAEDVSTQVKNLLTEQSSQQSRYIYYYSPQPTGRSKKANIVADRRRNAVIVQAPPNQMEAIEKMIKELDEPVTDGSIAPKIFALKYVSAVDLEEVLNELFLKKQQQRNYWDVYYEEYYGSGSSSSTADRDVGKLYGKVRIISEPYSNSLIVTANSKESLDAIEVVIQQLDRPSDAGESTLRLGLKFAKAPNVANSINILFARQGSPQLRGGPQQGQPQPNQQPQQQQQSSTSTRTGFDLQQEAKEEGYYPWLGGQPDATGRPGETRSGVRPVSDLVGRVRAVADPRANAVLVSANVHLLPQVLKLIEDLDQPTDQVLIEARLVEVATDYMDRLGVRWSPDGSQVFTAEDMDNSIMSRTGTRYLQGYGSKETVNTPTFGNVAQALTTLKSGVLDSTISMDFLIQFLRKTTDASVLAEPQLNIRDNETGRLFVGQEVPIPDNNQINQQGGQNTTFRYKPVGIVLEVTPHINSAGDIELTIHAEASTVVPGVTILGGAVFDTRNFRTDVRAKDGQTLVLGGIIQRLLNDTLRKTPGLGSIPAVGWAFKKKDKTTKAVELMVFLRPKVIRTAEDSRRLLDELDQRAPLIKRYKDEMKARDAQPDPATTPSRPLEPSGL